MRPRKPSRAKIRAGNALFAPLTLCRPVHEIENHEQKPDLQPALPLTDANPGINNGAKSKLELKLGGHGAASNG